MAYNEDLAERVKNILGGKPGFIMKKMFGGAFYLRNGNMACGVLNNDLIVRVGSQNYDKFLQLPGIRKFDITGRPMKGWVIVSFADEKSRKDIKKWVERGVAFAAGLPAK